MIILKSFFIALLFSSSIYFEYFNLTNIYLNTMTALVSIYFLFTIAKKELFYTGFFIGILWFWWIGYSFIYYDLIYLIPFIVLTIALIYGFLFYFIGLYTNVIYRIIILFTISFINPFSFNWFKPELIFINTIFDIGKVDFLIILICIGLFVHYKKIFFLIFLIFAIQYNTIKIPKANLKIYQPQYNVDQNIKWKVEYKDILIKENINNINFAIKNNYDLIILPETIFPLILNLDTNLLNILKKKSTKITIILGALEHDNNKIYNSTYMFQNSKVKIARKVVLVPFGEKIPLPQFLVNIINDMFYNGAEDYSSTSLPTSFNINGIIFRNAICYEATTDKIFDSLNTPYIIATSNNAWFTPSIEPTLQYLLLKYYAKKYNVIIYHSTNNSPNKIIQ